MLQIVPQTRDVYDPLSKVDAYGLPGRTATLFLIRFGPSRSLPGYGCKGVMAKA